MISAITLILAVAIFIQNEQQVFAIVGGELARDGEFPFVVSIRGEAIIGNCHFCAGTIISDRWILTSNACYSRSWWGSVRFGAIKNLVPVNYTCEPYNYTLQRHVDDVLYNPLAYEQPPYMHDLVLLHLNESIPFSENVQPVELANENDEWPIGKNGTIVGWGSGDCSDISSYQADLQKAQMLLYSDEYCSNSSIWNNWVLTDPFVMKCGGTGGEPYSTYTDYGGPLLVDGKQYGIISFVRTHPYPGGVCGVFPGIFSPISYFRQWIRDTTGI